MSPSPGGDDPLALAATPSRVAWRNLCERLDLAFDPALLPSLEAALASWPDALRGLPGRWRRALRHGDQHPALPLVRTVRATLFEAAPEPYAWARCAGLRRVVALHLRDEHLGDAGAMALASSPHLTRLTALSLGHGITADGARALAASPSLGGVVAFDLARNQLDAAAVTSLVASPHLGRVREVFLGRNGLGEASARALAAGPWRPSLVDLDANRLDGGAVAALRGGGLLADVATLNLSHNPVGRVGCEALAAAELPSLEVLYLHGCGLTDDDVAPLWGASWLPGLRNLALSGNRLGARALDALARCDALGGLRELDVCANALDAGEARARLGASHSLRGVRRLCV